MLTLSIYLFISFSIVSLGNKVGTTETLSNGKVKKLGHYVEILLKQLVFGYVIADKMSVSNTLTQLTFTL